MELLTKNVEEKIYFFFVVKVCIAFKWILFASSVSGDSITVGKFCIFPPTLVAHVSRVFMCEKFSDIGRFSAPHSCVSLFEKWGRGTKIHFAIRYKQTINSTNLYTSQFLKTRSDCVCAD